MKVQHIMIAVVAFGLAGSMLVPGPIEAANKDNGKKAPLKKPEKPSKIVPLGKMIKMTFAMKGSPEVPGLTVYCATESYSAQFNYEGPKGYLNIDVSGNMKLLEDGKTLLVTYQALIDFENGDGTAHASSSGSVLVKIGNEAKLLQLAGKDLVVRTQAVDPF